MEIIAWSDALKTRDGFAEMATKALLARERAYAPASLFKVGAVVAVVEHPGVLRSRQLQFSGCNVENAMYEVTHAEQAAIARMVLDLGTNPKPVVDAVVIACVADKEGQHALPCGFCRQWIAEFGMPGTRIYGIRLVSDGATVLNVECSTLGELLPYAFNL